MLVSVLLKYTIDAAKQIENQSNTDWLARVVEQWKLNALFSDFSLGFDDQDSSTQILTLQDLFMEACTRLGERDSISASEIHSWQLLEGERIYTRGMTQSQQHRLSCWERQSLACYKTN